jgi:hypothetical protein
MPEAGSWLPHEILGSLRTISSFQHLARWNDPGNLLNVAFQNFDQPGADRSTPLAKSCPWMSVPVPRQLDMVAGEAGD